MAGLAEITHQANGHIANLFSELRYQSARLDALVQGSEYDRAQREVSIVSNQGTGAAAPLVIPIPIAQDVRYELLACTVLASAGVAATRFISFHAGESGLLSPLFGNSTITIAAQASGNPVANAPLECPQGTSLSAVVLAADAGTQFTFTAFLRRLLPLPDPGSVGRGDGNRAVSGRLATENELGG